MQKDLEAKRKAARARALEDLAKDGSNDDQAIDAAAKKDPDNPPLDEQFWQRAKPLDAERLKGMRGPATRRMPKLPAAGE